MGGDMNGENFSFNLIKRDCCRTNFCQTQRSEVSQPHKKRFFIPINLPTAGRSGFRMTFQPCATQTKSCELMKNNV
jgi:hypothetical protein